ncbi:hypothetical protein BGW36DRAFT_360334 [Talaromyces proteolyticus]|uniref:Uncharacterized protein n=1 Tax=Talaromyces proteolyticus TaxID=1131652 RepID=A0AAD4KTY3_9EURO|nr:uncharacterized protein BGW36DRAFT_360334 [Talaromyces proteolyticus]KAH8696506.1 hypothetical protein BGW36DRAFT_360334 [Talaromyces proteolyticus]
MRYTANNTGIWLSFVKVILTPPVLVRNRLIANSLHNGAKLIEESVKKSEGGFESISKELVSYQLHWLRQQMVIVKQESFMFNRWVYENIEFGVTNVEWKNVPKSVMHNFTSH